MPRKPRFFISGVANHIVQRGNNKKAVFFEDEDYDHYKKILKDSASKHGVEIHAYVLMTNHIHLLATAESLNGISLMVQQTGRFYVPYINHKYQRTGTLWEGRFKSSLVDNDFYSLACMRYIELNPVRANMVRFPQDYKWSSYRANVGEHDDKLITNHVSYKALDVNKEYQQRFYRGLFLEHFDTLALKNIRNCVQTGTPLGGSRFIEQIENQLKMKVGYNQRGRPKS